MVADDPAAVFATILEQQGLHAALRFLNDRTPHRFTGVYRYDGEVLRNEHIFDAHDPDLQRGLDVPMFDAYCALVRQREQAVEFLDISSCTDVPIKGSSAVVSYVGVLIRDEQGNPFGTLCHHDVKRCETRSRDLPLLEAVTPLVHKVLRG